VATDTATKPTTITFYTQARNGKLVRLEPIEILGMNGTRIGRKETEVSYEFEPGERYGLGSYYGAGRASGFWTQARG
jgi:hypothetical protein